MNQTTNTKVGQAGNSLKLKARSIKRRSISRFQLLIIYINFMKKTKKAGRRKNMDVGRRLGSRAPKVLKKVAMAGFVVAVMKGVR